MTDYSAPLPTASKSSHSKVYDLLPAPFAWITIPAGKVTLGSGGYLKERQTFEVPAFSVAKYPVTNAQFARFIDAGGYREPRWWTEAGWKICQRGIQWDRDTGWWFSDHPWIEPRFRYSPQWNGADSPVVGVSWYEAVAFCRWLSEASGESVVLPTEQRWQRAAQGDDGRAYSWGNNWDCSRCANSVRPCKHEQTTPVRQYEGKSDSPFGVVDMTGNVWEWCLTEFETGSNSLDGKQNRVLRGGAWDTRMVSELRIFDRTWYGTPYNNFQFMGFRIARTL